MIEGGDGAPRDRERALSLFDRGCALGDWESCLDAADLLEYGLDAHEQPQLLVLSKEDEGRFMRYVARVDALKERSDGEKFFYRHTAGRDT